MGLNSEGLACESACVEVGVLPKSDEVESDVLVVVGAGGPKLNNDF